MGTWSVTLYGNDTSSDMRGDVREFFATPLAPDAVLAELTKKYPALDDAESEDYPDLWLALADQLHAHGIANAKVFATARAIVDKGIDLKMKRTLGMNQRDLAKRERLLQELRTKWAKPHSKPLKRKIQSKPDAFVFEVGDCITFPMTEADAAINPYFTKHDPGMETRRLRRAGGACPRPAFGRLRMVRRRTPESQNGQAPGVRPLRRRDGRSRTLAGRGAHGRKAAHRDLRRAPEAGSRQTHGVRRGRAPDAERQGNPPRSGPRLQAQLRTWHFRFERFDPGDRLAQRFEHPAVALPGMTAAA